MQTKPHTNTHKTEFEVPSNYPSSMFYIDDSGVKAAGDRILVIGGIKVRNHGTLLREIRHIRELTGFDREFKFTGLNQGSLVAYYAVIDALEQSDAHMVATVTKRPPGKGTCGWEYYAKITTRLLQGNINKRELVGISMDMISTPRNVAFEDSVKGMVNKRLGSKRVVTAACLDSKCSDGLQIADLVAGAIGYERRRLAGEIGLQDSPKFRIVNRLKSAFGITELADGRTNRVNIQTWIPTTRIR